MGEDQKEKAADSGTGAEGAEAKSPEEEAQARIGILEEEVKGLKNQCVIMEGQLKNRNPKLGAFLKKENASLNTRVTNLILALHGLLNDSQLSRKQDAELIRAEALRESAIEFFKSTHTEETLWKDLESSS